MINNKGQTLALFVIILPILLLLLVLIIDVGKVIVLKLELNNISKIVLDYGLDNMENEFLSDELINLVKLNKDDIHEIDIKVVDDRIYVGLETSLEGLFSKLVNVNLFDVETNYVGYIDNDEKRIERLGD